MSRVRALSCLAAAVAVLAPVLPLACVGSNNPAPSSPDAGGELTPDASSPDVSVPDTSLPDAPADAIAPDAPNDTSVASDAEAGPPVLEVIGQNLGNPDELVADPSFLYVTTGVTTEAGSVTRIVRCPIAGCGAGGPAIVADNLSVPGGLAISGSTLFWSEGFSAIKSCDVTTVPCTSTVFQTAVDEAGGGTFPTQIWVNAGHLYWIQQSGSDRTILTCPVAGCTAGYPKTVLFATTGSPLSGASTAGLAIDGSNAYVALFSGGPLLRYTMTSAEVADPASEANVGTTASGTHVLDLDGTTLRWAESNDGKIAACTTPACASVVDAVTGRTTPYAVAHDATYIYGVDKGTAGAGVLWRISKQ